MSNDKPPGGKRPGAGSAGGRRKRQPPTIDLTATEIAPIDNAGQEEIREISAAAERADTDLIREERAAGPSATEEWSRERRASSPPPPPPPPEEPKTFAPPPSSISMPLVATAIGAVAIVFLLILWIVNPFRARDDAATASATRLAQVETQLREVAARPLPVPFDLKPLDELSARITRIEGALSTRITNTESLAKQAADGAASMGRRIDDAATLARDARKEADSAATAAARSNPDAARTAVESLANRLAAIEQNTKAADAELAKRVAADDRGGRLAIAALALRAAVERGESFAAELGAVKSLNADTSLVAALEPYATAGIPSASSLARELSKLAVPMQQAAGTPVEGGFIEKLQANAERLVRIRPIEDVPGDDPATVIGRVEVKAARNDIAGALADIKKLPAHVRTLADEWIAKAQARETAIESSRKFAAQALTALGKTGP